MDYVERLAISYYNTIATINGPHKIYLVQHQESQKIYIKKILDVYNLHIYEYLKVHRLAGIPQLHNMYEENGQLTIIEEFISGTSLQEIIDSRALTIDLIIRFMCELCDILGQLHFLNPPIIHRDIKPSNIIITPYQHVVLIDFNAAKYLTDKNSSDTVLLGTKGYAAPEQYGFGSSTPQTDIYALGILLKELSSALTVPTNIFDAIINKCTQIDSSDRPANVHVLKSEFKKLKARNANSPQSPAHAAWSNWLPPGFRTKTPWKILTSSIIYLFILGLSLAFEVEDATAFQLWFSRVIFFLAMLSIVFCWFNYRNIQRFIPFCRNEYKIIRYLGILLLNAAVILILLLALIIAATLDTIF